jgi:exopolyphosphatase/guanosine-5'-triphosphate,3'-diphosphate pyrophosphatase
MIERHFFSQVITSVISLGRKFHFDEEHGVHVAQMALDIFDQLTKEHGLDSHARLLLEAAAILHDIGNYISTVRHDRHGQYIIANSEIFGFSRNDIKSIAFIVRFHHRLSPKVFPSGFSSLRREERIRVLKIAALLRLADGLDGGHTQKIPSLRLEKRDEEILLHADYEGGPRVERTHSRLKNELFEEVFGYRIRLL